MSKLNPVRKYFKNWVKPQKFILAGTKGKTFEGYVDLNPDSDERSVYPLFTLPVLKQIIAVTNEWGSDCEVLAYDAEKDEVIVDLSMGGDKDDPFEKSVYHFEPVEVEGIGKLYAVGWDADEWAEAKNQWLH